MAKVNKTKKGDKKPAVEIEGVTVKPMRRIVLETDGNRVNIAEADVSGVIELKAIMMTVIGAIDSGAIK